MNQHYIYYVTFHELTGQISISAVLNKIHTYNMLNLLLYSNEVLVLILSLNTRLEVYSQSIKRFKTLSSDQISNFRWHESLAYFYKSEVGQGQFLVKFELMSIPLDISQIDSSPPSPPWPNRPSHPQLPSSPSFPRLPSLPLPTLCLYYLCDIIGGRTDTFKTSTI